jgi:hypothetical protein
MTRLRWLSRLNRPTNQFFRAMPVRAKILLYAGIFFCFAPLGLLQDVQTVHLESGLQVAAATVYAGGMSAFLAWIILNHPRWFPVPMTMLVLAPLGFQYAFPRTPSPVELDAAGLAAVASRLRLVSGLIVLCMASAYISFVALVQREGLRYSGTYAEIKLAREIHATLVPDLSGQHQNLTWRGRSRPSGDVGGDLVDVVEDPRGWCATVADVSGHGVAAGVLMGMFKTAFHAVLSDAQDIADAVTRVNRVISPLRQPNMFITTACIRQGAPGRFEYVLAGHPAMLHISRGGTSSTWVGTSQLALGLIEHTVYRSGTVTLETGDMLVLVTDGLIEVFDRKDRELGLDGLQAAATAAARNGSLADVEQAMYAACAAHGAQLDDQTTLLVQHL